MYRIFPDGGIGHNRGMWLRLVPFLARFSVFHPLESWLGQKFSTSSFARARATLSFSAIILLPPSLLGSISLSGASS